MYKCNTNLSFLKATSRHSPDLNDYTGIEKSRNVKVTKTCSVTEGASD